MDLATRAQLGFLVASTLVMGCAADEDGGLSRPALDVGDVALDANSDVADSEPLGLDVIRPDTGCDACEPDSATPGDVFQDPDGRDDTGPDVPCEPETEAELCGLESIECGLATGADRCGLERSFHCGGCAELHVCDDGSCQPTYDWQHSAWGPCSVPCGSGVQTRTVRCVQLTDGAEVASSFCDAPQPATTGGCNLQACVCNYGDGINCTGGECVAQSPGRFLGVRNGGSGWGACLVMSSNACECRARSNGDVYCADNTDGITERSCYLGTL